MTFGVLMDRLNEIYVGNESDFGNMPVMVSSGGIQSPMGEFSLMNGRIVFSAVGEGVARESELRKTLLAMKGRVKEFGDLRSECHQRDRMDGVSEGWLSRAEIYRFEKDMEKLVKQALEDEKRNG